MRKAKRLFAVVLALVMSISMVTGFQSNVKAAEDVLYYSFMGTIKCKSSDNNLIFKKKSLNYNSSKKNFISYEGMYPAKKDYKFKLDKKIYLFVQDSWLPCHSVKKFGAKLNISSGKNISRTKFTKFIKKLPVTYDCQVIVKNGKLVAFGYKPAIHVIHSNI